MATYTNVPTRFLKAYYNFDIVLRDNSFGVHNAPFVVGLLKASIADLTGDANNDGLPDSWQQAYFGLIRAGPIQQAELSQPLREHYCVEP